MTKVTWFNNDTRRFMAGKYLKSGESIEDRIEEIAQQAGEYLAAAGLKEDKDEWVGKFTQYLSKGYFSLSTPVWTNYGKNRRALPISCNGTYVPDEMHGIMEAITEIAIQTKHGAGTSAYLGDLRSKTDALSSGGNASGPAHISELFDSVISVVSQGYTRRGNLAIYVDINHKDIRDFFKWRQEGSPIQNLSWGVCIPDDFIQELMSGNASQETSDIWKNILRCRISTGYPYLYFSDNVKRHTQDFGMPVRASNLCSEILLPTDENHSFVCCLASMNTSLYHEWYDTEAVEVLTDFLNTVLDEYYIKASKLKGLENSIRFTKRYRAIGIGQLGWSDYLQKNMIPFDSKEANEYAKLVTGVINTRAYGRSCQLAYLSDYKKVNGKDRVNATLTAIAPTTSSSFILGQTSPSIEPLMSNYFVKDLAAGKYTFFNKELDKQLDYIYDMHYADIEEEIKQNQGSIQDLDYPEMEHLKPVFKCFHELDMKSVIKQAASRFKYVDQAQSINLMYSHSNAKKIHEDIIFAWETGLPTLYYHRGFNPSQQLISKNRSKAKPKVECTEDVCVVCEG